MILHDLSVRADALVVTWADDSATPFPTIWLRDNCPSGLHPQTQERLLDLLTLDLSPVLLSAAQDGNIIKLGYADGHISHMPVALLSAHRPGQPAADPAAIPPELWRADLTVSGLPRFSAAQILSDDETLNIWMRQTAKFGLSIVDGLENRTSAGVEVARRISFLRETNFGTTFEVINKPGLYVRRFAASFRFAKSGGAAGVPIPPFPRQRSPRRRVDLRGRLCDSARPAG
jgi:gamma-butyrobetaine dioxygenase